MVLTPRFISRFEIEHIILGGLSPLKKLRKIEELKQSCTTEETYKLTILDKLELELKETHSIDDLISTFEADEKKILLENYSRLIAIDLITIGKVQPENMLTIATLPNEDFAYCIKESQIIAKDLNQRIMAVEHGSIDEIEDRIPEQLLE